MYGKSDWATFGVLRVVHAIYWVLNCDTMDQVGGNSGDKVREVTSIDTASVLKLLCKDRKVLMAINMVI